jgi:hypothetical protein
MREHMLGTSGQGPSKCLAVGTGLHLLVMQARRGPSGTATLRFTGITDEQDVGMTSAQRSVTVPGMAQAQQDIAAALATGKRNQAAIEGERQALYSAYQSEQASPIMDRAILEWENQLVQVLAKLEQFDTEIDAAKRGYSNADSAAADAAQQLRSAVVVDGLPGL